MCMTAILESNPFSDEDNSSVSSSEKPTVDTVLSVYQTTLNILKDNQLHTEIVSHLFCYLFFFTNTSLFNLLMSKGMWWQCSSLGSSYCDRYQFIFPDQNLKLSFCFVRDRPSLLQVVKGCSAARQPGCCWGMGSWKWTSLWSKFISETDKQCGWSSGYSKSTASAGKLGHLISNTCT